MPTPRERAREQTLADITRLGREQLVRVGAADLSVRSLARDLGVVSSAVYRYVRSRDDLLTLLVVDAYDELGEAAEKAATRPRSGDHRGRFRAVSRAVRAWAVAEPARYALLFGSPVPGYVAPAEQTTGPGTRVPLLYGRLCVEAYEAGALAAPALVAPLPRALRSDLDRVAAELGSALPTTLVARMMLAWSSVFGAVGFEVFGQYGPDLAAPRQLFDHHVEAIMDQLGLVEE
ncbi:TetR/AcrR family transcriptional regulator [Marmoricola endophyticus]|uniref:TetR/AcrR family transcriptional regulator n=1 Tax=Marmoricola endophyticus TaxID=2040280 RepID=UPI001E6288F1|nr:TetR-like C-terminal domain-containing protein [Marmoricola endophyticus]